MHKNVHYLVKHIDLLDRNKFVLPDQESFEDLQIKHASYQMQVPRVTKKAKLHVSSAHRAACTSTQALENTDILLRNLSRLGRVWQLAASQEHLQLL